MIFAYFVANSFFESDGVSKRTSLELTQLVTTAAHVGSVPDTLWLEELNDYPLFVKSMKSVADILLHESRKNRK